MILEDIEVPLVKFIIHFYDVVPCPW